MAKWKLPDGRKPLTTMESADLVLRMHKKLEAGFSKGDRIAKLEEMVEACKADAREAEAYAAELEAELHLMKTAGIVEVAIRNPNVSEYMAHWERRAEGAEAKLAKARENALREAFCLGADNSLVARTTLAELKGQDGE